MDIHKVWTDKDKAMVKKIVACLRSMDWSMKGDDAIELTSAVFWLRDLYDVMTAPPPTQVTSLEEKKQPAKMEAIHATTGKGRSAQSKEKAGKSTAKGSRSKAKG